MGKLFILRPSAGRRTLQKPRSTDIRIACPVSERRMKPAPIGAASFVFAPTEVRR
jgi:hypothetical protein